MKLPSLLMTCFAFPALTMAGITTSGSVFTQSGATYDGSDPWVINGGRLNVGSSTVTGGLEIDAGSSVIIGLSISDIIVTSPSAGVSKSSLVVDGAGSNVTTPSLILDGALLRVRNGASLNNNFSTFNSFLVSRDGETIVEGPGSTLKVGNISFVGTGRSQISVSNGAHLSSLGLDKFDNSSVSVSYEPSFSITVGGGSHTSQWLSTGRVLMGSTAGDLIDIRGGGLVSMPRGQMELGLSSSGFSGSGTVRVDGTEGAAELQIFSARIGTSGTGSLVATNGGIVKSAGYFLVGSESGGRGTLRVGGGSKVSKFEGEFGDKPTVYVAGAASLVEVLENGILEAGDVGVVGGASLAVGGGLGPATVTLTPGPFFQYGELSVSSGGRVDVRQGGTISAAKFSVSDSTSQVSLDGGTLKGAGYLGGLPVQIMAGGGTIQAGIGGFTLSATTGVGLLAKTGAGSMTFAGQTNHAGTRVVEGSLNLAAGSRTTGTVEILAGAKLTGTGTMDGLLTLQQGAVIAPGNSPGILQTGASVWMSGGRYEWEINNALGNKGINWDLVQINGSLDLVGLSPSDPFVIALRSLFESTDNAGLATNFDSQSNYRFTILTTTSGITGFDPSDFRLDLTGFANPDLGDAYWALQEWNNGLDLVYNFAPVPEPGSVIFIAVTALAALAQRRRH